MNYAGQVAVNGEAFDGTGLFKFALVDADGKATYWSNDGTSVSGSEPQGSIQVPVNGGLYSILLGNTAIQAMNALDPAIFHQYSDVKLRVWFSDGVNGFQQLSPDRPFASVPYALTAGDVSDSSISLNRLSPEVLGALNILPSISTQPFARYDRSNGSAQMEVSARGHNLSYQWLKNGQPLNRANTPILQITNIVLDGNDTYAVRISNSLGQTTSLPVLLRDAIGAPGPELEEANATQVQHDGLVLWLDAQDTDGNGVADNLPEGTKVQTWSDRSGNENHLLQPEENLAPTISTNGNRQSLHFLLPEKMRLDQNFTLATVFMVMKVPESLKTSDATLLNTLGASLRKRSNRSIFTTNENNILLSRDSLLTNGIFPNGAIFYDQNAVYYGSCNRFLEWIELAKSWSGQIHEIIFYERYLSESENASVTTYLKNKWQVPENIQTNSVDGMIAHYKFEPNETGKIIYDSSGNNHHVELSGPLDEATLISGLDGSALALPGDDANYLKLPSYESPMKTIALWLKPNFPIQVGSYPFALFQCGNLKGLIFNESSTKLSNESIALGHFTENASSRHSATSTSIPNGWIHLTLAWNEESGQYEYFLNGQPISTVAGMHGHFDLLTGANIQFGKKVYTNQHGETAAYSGAIDELRIYEIALTAPEVLFLHNQVRAPFIRTAGEYNATIGNGFSLNLQVENDANLFRAEGLPSGLSLNVVTGEISGVPLISGYHRVYLTAANEHGKTAGVISIHARSEMDLANWPVDIPDGSDIPQNGLVLWLDANDVDADGEFDTGTDHLKLSNWSDKAGKDNNATQATTANQPKIRTGQLLERPGLNLLVFDGNQSLSLPNMNQGRTFFFVANRGPNHNYHSSFVGLSGVPYQSAWGTTVSNGLFVYATPLITSGLQKQNGQDKDLQSANSYLTDLQIIALRTTDFVSIDLIGTREGANYINGKIAEILIYDQALSENEIETVEQYLGSKWGIALVGDTAQPDFTDGLVAHLPFDENTGVVANDLTGNGYNAALVGYDGNATWVPGKIGGALKFDGGEFGTLPRPFYDFFTVCFWMKSLQHHTQTGNAQEWKTPGIMGGPASNYGIMNRASKIVFRAGVSSLYFISNTTVSTGQWCHVAVRLNKTTKARQILVNGLLDKSVSEWDDPDSPPVNEGNWEIGRATFSDASSFFVGELDDLRIYNQWIGIATIQALYDLGSSPLATTTYASPNPSFTLTPATNSVTTAHLTQQILKYLKPVITTQPEATNVYSDSNHTFSVSAEGKYLSYQWKKDSLNLAGETNATLVLTDANATQHDGNYSVVVSNDFGSVESGTFEQKIISWHPKLLDGLILWADASDSSTIVKNNTRISNWADKSGQGNHFTQSTENSMPFFGVDKINDLNALSGDDTFMTTTNNPFGTSVSDAFVTMVVEIKNVADCSFINLRGGGDNFNERWGAGIVQSWNEILFDVSGVNSPYRLRTNVDWNASDQIIFGFYSSASGNAQQIWKNGNLLIGDSNSEVSLTDGGIKIGNLNGLILGEVFIVNGEINTNERIASEGYLAHKWNLSAELPSNHNYKSNAP